MRDVVRICVSFFLFYFRYIISCTLVLWPFDIHCSYIWFIYIYWCMLFHLCLHVSFLFSHASYLLYEILYFCFTLRCLDEFCLKRFRNTSCRNLLAISSFLAKFFQVFVLGYILLYSTIDYDLSDLWLLSYFICLLWFCHRLPKGEIVRTYVIQC